MSKTLKVRENLKDLFEAIGLVKKANMTNAKSRGQDALIRLAVVVNDFDKRLTELEQK
jgi:hypothetical protein